MENIERSELPPAAVVDKKEDVSRSYEGDDRRRRSRSRERRRHRDGERERGEHRHRSRRHRRRRRRDDDDDYDYYRRRDREDYARRGRSRERRSRSKSSSQYYRHMRESSPRGSRRRKEEDEIPIASSGEKILNNKEVDVEKVPQEKKKEKDMDDLTKDQRTVFVSQLVMKANEKQLKSFFEKIGKVKDVIMIRDKYTNRHKGFAYVEMADLESVPMVLMLNGTLPDFQKFPILVKASEAEKNFIAAASSSSSKNLSYTSNQPRRRLLIEHLHPKISENDLNTVLSPFGEIDEIELVPGSQQAYVTYVHADDATQAATRLTGIELGAGIPIQISFTESSISDAPGGNTIGDWRLDADNDGGLAMDASSRAALMQQLGKRAGISEVQQAFARHEPSTSTTINKVAPLIGPPLAAICISNMFDPAKETDPNWRDDIREDVTLECEKFGKVIHIHVDAISTRGLVHILFDSNLSAQKAAAALHGRYFAGRPISLTYVDPKTHRMQFADEIN